MTYMETLSFELRKLGLSEKEVRVYLAALEFGYATAQKIAQKLNISRPTIYEIIKALKSKGLMSEFKEDKRTYFTAESPDKLLRILHIQKREIEEKERELLRVIAALRAKYHLGEEKLTKAYQGPAGLKILESDLLETHSREIYVINSRNIPLNLKLIWSSIRKRLGQIEIKEISVKKSIPASLIIYDKIIFISQSKPFKGILIEDKNFTAILKRLAEDTPRGRASWS